MEEVAGDTAVMGDRDPWELEHEELGRPRLEFKPKAHLVLEGSNRFDWGVVKDCHGLVNLIPDDAEIVGTWNKYNYSENDGVFWVDLMTPLTALEDRATQLYAELAQGRSEAMAKLGMTGPIKRVSKTPRAPKEPKVEQPIDDRLDKLRSMFIKK